ncbi:hypothetical protein D3C81_1362350 [compost metagenome]
MVRQAPGASASHGPWNMKVRPSPDSMPPQVGAGGGTPRPRKDRPDSARIAVPTRVVNSTITGGSTLGRMWRNRMRPVDAPIDCAACTYMFSRTDTTALRTMREPPMPSSSPSVQTICQLPGPSTDTTTIRITRSGKLIQASTMRCTNRSNLPPR